MARTIVVTGAASGTSHRRLAGRGGGGLATFLAPDKARYVAGARIVIDGGPSPMRALGA